MAAPIRDLNSEALAKRLNRHKFTVHRWARKGWIRSTRMGNRAFFFNWDEVVEDMKTARLKPGKLKPTK